MMSRRKKEPFAIHFLDAKPRWDTLNLRSVVSQRGTSLNFGELCRM